MIYVDFIVVIFGSCVIMVSAVVLTQNTTLGVMCYNMFYSSSVNILLAGIASTGNRVLRCLGVLRDRPVLLKRCAEFVMILLTVVLIVVIIRIFFTDSVSNLLIERMTSMFDLYGNKGNDFLTLNLDAFQHWIHCCGITGYSDWGNFTYGNNMNVADGCCRNMTAGCGKGLLQNPDVEDLVYTMGCLPFVSKVFYIVWLTLAILSFILICVEAVNTIVSCVKARNSNGYETLQD